MRKPFTTTTRLGMFRLSSRVSITHASSFGKFLKISFNERGHIESGKIIDYLLEKVCSEFISDFIC